MFPGHPVFKLFAFSICILIHAKISYNHSMKNDTIIFIYVHLNVFTNVQTISTHIVNMNIL